jgi:hypothetical protein
LPRTSIGECGAVRAHSASGNQKKSAIAILRENGIRFARFWESLK